MTTRLPGLANPGEEVERLRRELESETKRCLHLQRQMDHAVAQFQEFVSIAAHDLRESLREMTAFSQLLSENLAGQPGSRPEEFLARIQEASAKAGGLLTEIVDLWETGSGERPTGAVDMEAVLRQAMRSDAAKITNRNASITHDPLPIVYGDFATLAKVLHRLVDNGVEYSASPTPSVHISYRREHDEHIFALRDNGPGIDSRFHDRIFEPFRRLHGKEHAGNGLGLAFCMRAIEWHGGRIWVESTPGSGSVF